MLRSYGGAVQQCTVPTNLTAHKLQGATVDQSLVFYEKQVGYEAFNVMMTRHRETTALYADRQSLHDNIYARLDMNVAEARKVYQITGAETKGGKVSRDDIDLIGLNIGVSRRVNNSFAGDYADMGLNKTDHTIKEYMETSKQSGDLIRQISKWQIQQERITGSKPQMHSHELWPNFYEVKQQRNNLARTIVTDYNNYQERITQLGINYATLEKRAYELKTYKVEERSSILYKESENYFKLTAAIKDNKPEQIKQYYHALRAEIVDNDLKLEKAETHLANFKAEHLQQIQAISDHRQYQDKLLPKYLQRVYRDSPDEVLSKWQKLLYQHGKFMAAEMVNKNPELLGKLHGVGFGKWLAISNKRIDVITNIETLGKHLKQYETSKEQESILDKKLGTSQYPRIKSELEEEVSYLKSLMPARIDNEFITEVGKVLHDYSRNNGNYSNYGSNTHNSNKDADNKDNSTKDNDNKENYSNYNNYNYTNHNINSDHKNNLNATPDNTIPGANLAQLNSRLSTIDQAFKQKQLEIVNKINREIRHFKEHDMVERDGKRFLNAEHYLEHITQDKLLAPYLRNTDTHKQLDRLNKVQQREMTKYEKNFDKEFSM